MKTQILGTLFISFMASISTVLGGLILLFISKKNKNGNKILAISLGFAAGVMLSVAFLDLYPEMLQIFESKFGHKMGVLISLAPVMLGISFGGAIDTMFPEKTEGFSIYRVGLISTITVALHNLPEGIATFISGYTNIELGLEVALAIALHNMPEGISIAMPIYYATKSKIKALKFTFYSGICEFLGAVFACIFLRNYISNNILGGIFGFVSGIMIYISIEELIPSSRKYNEDKLALLATFIGICIMPLTHII